MTATKQKVNTVQKTKKDETAISMYIREIGRFPLLNREEEEQVARAAAEGDKKAREKLINSNLRFVVNVAKKYQGKGLPLEDLISEGNVGLINAVDRFDADKKCHFISYAVWWIRQSILVALCEKTRMIRLPSNKAAKLIQIEKARKATNKHQSENEEIKEIANLLNMEDEHVVELLNISRDILSLENPVSGEHDVLLMDFIEDNQYRTPEQHIEQGILEEDIENVLRTMGKKEAEIIRCHYGLGRRPVMTLKEIGERFKLSKERIRQIEEKALTRLQNPIRKELLQMYSA